MLCKCHSPSLLHVPDPALPSPSSSSYFLLPRWVSVLQNSKDEALSNAFKGDGGSGGVAAGTGVDDGMQELTRLVISEVKNMPGNKQCCDCGAPGMSGPGVPTLGVSQLSWESQHLWGLGVVLNTSPLPPQIPHGFLPTLAS